MGTNLFQKFGASSYTYMKRCSIQYVFLLLLLLPQLSYAHPHSWVDMKTYVQGTNDTITGFKQEWTFDPMTTAYMFDGEDMSPAHQKETMQKVADSVMKNLLNSHYYTYFYDNNTPIKYLVAKNGKLTKKGPKATLSFELPLAHPKKVTADSIVLHVFEPTYYMDMTWDKASDIVLAPELAKTCSFKLIPAHPTPEEVSYAMSLPPDADPDNTLGQLFTQTVKFHCNVPQDSKDQAKEKVDENKK